AAALRLATSPVAPLRVAAVRVAALRVAPLRVAALRGAALRVAPLRVATARMVVLVVAAVLVVTAVLVPAGPALARSLPLDRPVPRPFALGADPYAAGQHRGVDIGAAAGAPVVAPAAGLVSFAGSLPGNGLVVTIQTPDGYSVTLVHLGSIAVARDARVSEGSP